MKKLCFYFQIHQPDRLRVFRFFDIGKDSHYYDDFVNRTILRRVAQKCYLPMNDVLYDAIKSCGGKFKVAFSITGSALEQFERYAPEVIDSFRRLASTGCVEFLCETCNHSLSSLKSENEFRHQVQRHKATVERYFGQTPVTFRNTELIYSDSIGKTVYEMGFKTILTEGARHILGWKSPNYLYSNNIKPSQKLLLRNYHLSDDIAFRFAGSGLTSEQFVQRVLDEPGEIVNIFMDYETFGEHQSAETGIFEFMKALPSAAIAAGIKFVTPAEAASRLKAAGPLSVPQPISWADEERDVTAWLGNELQQDAFNKLYGLVEKLSIIDNADLWADFGRLQESDHFYYMCTKFFSDGDVHKYFNPYDTPYEAFINYMNVLSDFIIRVNDEYATKN